MPFTYIFLYAINVTFQQKTIKNKHFNRSNRDCCLSVFWIWFIIQVWNDFHQIRMNRFFGRISVRYASGMRFCQFHDQTNGLRLGAQLSDGSVADISAQYPDLKVSPENSRNFGLTDVLVVDFRWCWRNFKSNSFSPFFWRTCSW